MSDGAELLLVGGVAAVGVLHTMVPDHWMPIAILARQRGWSRAETALASVQAGIGHVGSTLLIGLAAWASGVVFAGRFGAVVDLASSLALVAFGTWIAFASLAELRRSGSGAHATGTWAPRTVIITANPGMTTGSAGTGTSRNGPPTRFIGPWAAMSRH
jgi:hypothetical protein